MADRIRAVAENELEAKLEFNKTPLAVNVVIHNARKNRSHFTSLLYPQCSLVTQPYESLNG